MRLAPAILWASVAIGMLVACNFIVDAEFSGKTFPGQGQDGSVVVGDCPLGNMPQDPGCSNCMLTSCKSEFAAICKDGDMAQGKAYLGACVDDPSVTQGNCERIFIDAGAEQTFSDPTTHYFNMRVCVTDKCKTACTTCTDITYDRYVGDNMPPPFASANTPCSKCLLDNCQSALLGGGTQFSHCCYQARIDATWGPCARPMSPDCSGIKNAVDAGSSTGCDYTLAKCAVDNCKASCGL